MTLRLTSLLLAGLFALGCEGGLVIDVGGGGGGSGPRIDLDDGGSPRLADGGPGAVPSPAPEIPPGPCALPAEGRCDGNVALWCLGQETRFADCGVAGQVCRIIGGGVACVADEGSDPDPDPDPIPDPGPTPTACAGIEEQEVIDLANGERSSALTCDTDMARAARKHSQDMCDQNYFSHDGRDGRSPFDRMRDEGVMYGTAGENIAYGQTSPSEVHRSWMNSSGHRRNIVSTSYRRIGVGYAPCSGKHYWTQVFAD